MHSIAERIRFQKNHSVWKPQYDAFIYEISRLPLPKNSKALSISCGDGMWDYVACASNRKIGSIVATDIVDCPVKKEDIDLLETQTDWSFIKVAPDNKLPIRDECFDLVFHQDVIEHTARPFLLLAENYRVLKNGGYLLFGTPNIFRPANLLKLAAGKLTFPSRIGYTRRLGHVTHLQEFNEHQTKIMLAEVGFKVSSVTHCFWGVSFLNIKFADFPKGHIGKSLCQYLFFVAQKPL